MSVALFPRLDAIEAEGWVALYQEVPPKNLVISGDADFPAKVTFATSGGHPVTVQYLRDLQKSVTEIALGCGFPKKSSPEQRAKFDEGASILLASLPYLLSGEAMRDDIWAFIATLLLPEVVVWRFGISSERYLGGIRNTFQRLWVRGTLFDRGEGSENRWQLLRSLTEDAMVQITERAAIAGDKRLALACAEAWERAGLRYPKGEMEDLMRKAIIGIRLRNEIMMLSFSDPANLPAALDGEFNRAARTLSISETRHR